MMDYINYLEMLGVPNDSIAFSRTLKEHEYWLFNIPSPSPPPTIANLNRLLENISSVKMLLKRESHKEPQISQSKSSYIFGLSQPIAWVTRFPIIVSVLLLEQIPRKPYYSFVFIVPGILLVLQKVLNNTFKLDVTGHMWVVDFSA